ncbi:MAG: ATP-binding cassette domain-containing protein [Herminiimonas sp.]|nr:ATP-binding cassette domain-containing protein [Herminiimonas sp.]
MLFDKVTMAIAAGVTLICGDEGTGKTTLLRLLATDLVAEAGDLQVGDVLFSAQPEAYRQHVFWADPRTDTLEHTTPREYFKATQQAWPAFNERVLDASIAGLSLGPHLDKKLFMLSTGSKRKVWLAAAFASGASVLLIDEPFVALDGASIAFVLSLLKRAENDPSSACVIANYEAPGGVALAGFIDLDAIR